MEEIKQDLKPLFEVLPPWAKWIAKDENGLVYYYEYKPYFDNSWIWKSHEYSSIPQNYIPQSYKDLDWKESLIEVVKTKHKNTF